MDPAIDQALTNIVAAVDAEQSKQAKPLQAVTKDELVAFKVDAADVDALGKDSGVSVSPYTSPYGSGYMIQTRLVKGEDIYLNVVNKGPDPTVWVKQVGTCINNGGKDGGPVDDWDVQWVDRGWERVENLIDPMTDVKAGP